MGFRGGKSMGSGHPADTEARTAGTVNAGPEGSAYSDRRDRQCWPNCSLAGWQRPLPGPYPVSACARPKFPDRPCIQHLRSAYRDQDADAAAVGTPCRCCTPTGNPAGRERS